MERSNKNLWPVSLPGGTKIKNYKTDRCSRTIRQNSSEPDMINNMVRGTLASSKDPV